VLPFAVRTFLPAVGGAITRLIEGKGRFYFFVGLSNNIVLKILYLEKPALFSVTFEIYQKQVKPANLINPNAQKYTALYYCLCTSPGYTCIFQ